jgi:thioredoxin 1
MSVVNLSDNEAVEKFLIMNSKAVLYYTAMWCGPCRQIKPIYEEMAKKYAGEVAFGKVDVDDNPDAAQVAQITAVPTFVAYVDEKQLTRFSGADTNQLQDMADQLKKHQ